MNIEALDKWLWVAVIIPVIAILGYAMGIKESLLVLVLLLPFIIMIKNQYLENKIAWRDEYSVGIEAMDNDHQHLLELILRTFKSLSSARGKDKTAEVIDELIEYTVTHFAREEGLMREHGFPGLEGHIKEHEMMRSKMLEFKDNLDSNSSKVSSEVLRFLQNWLVNHITSTDKQYSEFLLGKGVK